MKLLVYAIALSVTFGALSASVATAQCDGTGMCFCNNNAAPGIAIDQLVRAVNIALGTIECPADPDTPTPLNTPTLRQTPTDTPTVEPTQTSTSAPTLTPASTNTPASTSTPTMSTSDCAPTGPNLAVNGDFETGTFSCIEQFENAGTQTVSMVNPHAGTYSANLNLVVPTSDTLIKFANLAPGSFSPGQTVYISFYMRGSLAPGGVGFAEFFSELSAGGTSSTEILFGGGPIFPDGDPDTWTLFSTTAQTGPDTSGGITLLLKGASGGGELVDLYFDDVCISTTDGVCP